MSDGRRQEAAEEEQEQGRKCLHPQVNVEQRLQLRVTVCVTVCASLPFKEEARNSCGCCGKRRLRGVTEKEAERRWECERGGGGRETEKAGEKGLFRRGSQDIGGEPKRRRRESSVLKHDHQIRPG